MNTTRSVGTSSTVTQEELNRIGECLKLALEQNPNELLEGGQHYLIDLYQGDEAADAWRRESSQQGGSEPMERARLVYRMMSGVVQKQQKTLFPWTTFCFKPAAVEGASGHQSFLNLQAMRSVSRRLWAMVRVHYPQDSKRPPELCCYVGRHIPALDVTIEPQLRIPLRAAIKLAVDERNGIALPSALFSDNTNLGKPMQSTPQFVDVIEAGEEGVTITLSNASSEAVTICEVAVCDYDEEEIELGEGVEVEGAEGGVVIPPRGSIKVKLSARADVRDTLDSLIIGYARGTEEDLDEDDDELMTEEELVVKLQGEDTRTSHFFLAQGSSYDLLKQALLEPETFINSLGEDLAAESLVNMDIAGEITAASGGSLLLNSADLDGGSIGTVSLCFESQRASEDFTAMMSADQDEESDLTGDHFTFGERSALPIGFTENKVNKSKKAINAPYQSVKVELIYLGKMDFYNELSVVDHRRAYNFILNCVALASLVRGLTAKIDRSEPETANDLLL